MCKTLYEFDSMNKAEDHYPTMLHVVSEVSAPAMKDTSWRTPCCNKDLLADPERISLFVEEVANIPILPWATPIDSHISQDTTAIIEIAGCVSLLPWRPR